MKTWKKAVGLAVMAAMAVGLIGCGGQQEGSKSTGGKEKVHLTVFAAASMTETLNQLKTEYEKQHPDVELTFNYDSSGTLKKQIQNGAECDIFISAAQKQMNQLDGSKDATANPDKLDFIDSATRINLLENKVVLVTPEGNPKQIQNFNDMAEKAIASAGNITYGSNVKEVTTQVLEGSADCGVVYATDAFSAKLKPVDQATKEMCGQVIYPAAVLKNSKQQDAAKDFLKFLQSDEAMKVFESVGFSRV